MNNISKGSTSDSHPLIFLTISLLGHIALISTLSLLFVFDKIEPAPPPSKQVIKVIEKAKILGEKKSKRKDFAPLPEKKSKRDKINDLDLSKLRPEKKIVKPSRKISEQKVSSKIIDQKKPNLKPGNEIRTTVISSANKTPETRRVLSNKDFDMEFTPPEGVSEDELNSFDKIFYSFIKRTYEKYINSFVTSYFALSSERPYLIQDIETKKHLIKARATFDRKGNIIAIKIFNNESSDAVYDLFERTIKGIDSLPNPPKEFFQGGDEEFNIYFVLKVNL